MYRVQNMRRGFLYERGNKYAKKRQTTLQSWLLGCLAGSIRIACANSALVILVVCARSVFNICRFVCNQMVNVKMFWRHFYESYGYLSTAVHSCFIEKDFSLE